MFDETREKALEIYHEGGNIVKYLSPFSDSCSLFNASIKKSIEIPPTFDEMMSGRYQDSTYTSYLVEMNDGRKYKVLKHLAYPLSGELFKIKRTTTLGKFAEKMERERLIPKELFVDLNGGNSDRILKAGNHNLDFPEYAKFCLTKEDLVFERGDGKPGMIPKGSYMCRNEAYSEFIIGVLCGSLYRNGISANFCDTFSFLTCPSKKKGSERVSQYIFEEWTDSSLLGIPLCYEEMKIFECMFVQVLHAIAVYQGEFKLQHNNLHPGNIFIKHLKREEKTEFLGQDLFEADYFHYRVGKIDLYLPWIPFLVKIGDFRSGVKYSEPMIGSAYDMATSFPDETIVIVEEGDEDDDDEEFITPNWYSPSYDSLSAAISFDSMNEMNPFVNSILGWMKKGVNDDIFMFEGLYFLPDCKISGTLLKDSTAWNVLTNKTLMKKYLKKPKEGRIVELGVARKR